jgi:peptide/nickel transport system permease protein
MSAVSVSSITSETVPAGGTGRFTAALRFALGSPRMTIGLVILVFFILVAIIGPYLVPHATAFVGSPMAKPSGRFWLGTTQSGQNVFDELVVSARGTLEVGAAAGLLATLIAVVCGVAGGYIGGAIDDILNVLTNIVLVIPGLPLVIIVAAFLKSGGELPVILVIAFTGWAGAARVLRASALSIRSRDYILATRASGERLWRIIVVELLPNVMAVIISGFIFAVIFAILTQAGLEFIGLGDPNSLTWGNMLYVAENDQALADGAWWWFAPPALCIALVGTALALVNFGMDQMLNPRLRGLRGRGGR